MSKIGHDYVGPFEEAGIPCKHDTQPITIMTPTHDYRLVVRKKTLVGITEKRIILQRGYLRNNGSTCEHMWVDLPTIVEDEETEG